MEILIIAGLAIYAASITIYVQRQRRHNKRKLDKMVEFTLAAMQASLKEGRRKAGV